MKRANESGGEVSDFRKHFRRQLMEFRRVARLTQEDLARQMRPTSSNRTISDLERGIGTKVPERAPVASYIEACFRVSPEDSSVKVARRNDLDAMNETLVHPLESRGDRRRVGKRPERTVHDHENAVEALGTVGRWGRRSILYGRDHQISSSLNHIVTALGDFKSDRQPSIAAIGPPGSGKTKLANWLVASTMDLVAMRYHGWALLATNGNPGQEAFVKMERAATKRCVGPHSRCLTGSRMAGQAIRWDYPEGSPEMQKAPRGAGVARIRRGHGMSAAVIRVAHLPDRTESGPVVHARFGAPAEMAFEMRKDREAKQSAWRGNR